VNEVILRRCLETALNNQRPANEISRIEVEALEGIVGKRLLYADSSVA
jgi:hypothetical protein